MIDEGAPSTSLIAPAGAASAHEKGRAIFNFRCYFCHGYSGDAKTLASTFLSPKPRSFTTISPRTLSRDVMIDAVTRGRPGSAMMGFSSVLKPAEIEAVVDFVRREFMEHARPNTRYHTVENGWPEHEKYRIAYPFALGQVAIDADAETLTPEQRAGRQLFLSSCISCHDRGFVKQEGAIWETRPLSFPRNGYSHQSSRLDATSGASAYKVHDAPPVFTGLTAPERVGQKLFQENCAFCHAADGTGRNWIGSFLDAHPRDLTGSRVAGMSDAQIAEVIRDGIKGTTMSAWKDVLNEDQVQAVVAYVRRVFIAPGDTSTFNDSSKLN